MKRPPDKKRRPRFGRAWLSFEDFADFMELPEDERPWAALFYGAGYRAAEIDHGWDPPRPPDQVLTGKSQ